MGSGIGVCGLECTGSSPPFGMLFFFLQPCNTTLLHGNKVWLLPFQFQGCNACLVTRLVLPCYKAGKPAYYQVVIFIWVLG